jgi:hypothetical protein
MVAAIGGAAWITIHAREGVGVERTREGELM